MTRAAALLSAMAALAVAAPAAAQAPGRWAPWINSGTTVDVPAPAVPVLRGHAETILTTMFRSAPVLANPDATWWGMRVRYVGPPEDAVWTEGTARWPLGAGFYASIIRSSTDDAGRVHWEDTEARRSIGIGVATNSLKCVFPSQHQPFYQDETGPIYETPAKTGEVGGFPVYNTDCLAITRRDEPMFLPATRDRVAKVALAKARTTLADMDRGLAEARKAGMPQVVAELQETRAHDARAVAQLQALIAGMGPAERNAPAYVRSEALLIGGDRSQLFAEETGEGIVSLVYPNPTFFSLDHPTDIQLITIGLGEVGPLGCSHPVCEPADQAFFEQFNAQMNWSALAALTRP